MGGGANPGGFLSGLWGVVGPRIEEKYQQKLARQSAEKDYQLQVHHDAMRNASIELERKRQDGTLTPEEAQRLSTMTQMSDAEIQKIIGKDKELGPMWQKVSGAVKQRLSHKGRQQPATAAPAAAPQAGAAPSGAQPQGAPAASGAAASGAAAALGPTQLPAPQTPPPPSLQEVRMSEMAMASRTKLDFDRERREEYAEKHGKEWTSKEKAEWVDSGKFPTTRANTAAEKNEVLLQAAIDSGNFGDPDDPETVRKAKAAVGKLLVAEETTKSEGRAHNFTKQWVKLADGKPLQVFVDPRPPFTVIDPKTNKPPDQDYTFLDESLQNQKERAWSFGRKSDALAIAKSKMEPKYAPLIKTGQLTREELDEMEKDYAGAIVSQEVENTLGRQLQQAQVTAGTEDVPATGVTGALPPVPAPPAQTPQAPPAPQTAGGGPSAAPVPTPAAPAQPAAPAPAAPAPSKFAPLSGANAPKELQPATPAPAPAAPAAPAPPAAVPAQYVPVIEKAATDNGIGSGLLTAVLRNESRFNPNAVSPKGAQGIAQFMPATAKDQGLQNANNPDQAIPAAAKYLAQLRDQFKGDTRLAVAAYNAGPKAVWNAGGDVTKLPKETQDYVARVMKEAGAALETAPTTTELAAGLGMPKSKLPANDQINVDAWIKSALSGAKMNNRAIKGLTLAIERTGLDANDLTTAAINHQDLMKTLQNTYGRMAAYNQLQDVVRRFGENYIAAAKEWKEMTGQPLENAAIQEWQKNIGDHPALARLLVATQSLQGAYGRIRASSPQSAAMPPVFAMQEGQLAIKPNATMNVMKASVAQIEVEAQSETDAMHDTIGRVNTQLQSDPIADIYGQKKFPLDLGAPGPKKTTLDGPKTGQSVEDEVKAYKAKHKL